MKKKIRESRNPASCAPSPVSRVSCLVFQISVLPTRETPREFGFRLTLSGFSAKTACAISTYLRLRFDPSSSVSARFLRAPVLPFARRPLPVRAAPEGPVWTPPHLAAVRCDSPGSGRPRRPLASLSEECDANPGSRPKPVHPEIRPILRTGSLPPLRRWARKPFVRITLPAEAVRASGNLRSVGALCQSNRLVCFRALA